MWRRNESASMRKTSSSPACVPARRQHAAAEDAVLGLRGVKARKSCSPRSAAAQAASSSCETSRDQCQVRAARSGEGARERRTRYS